MILQKRQKMFAAHASGSVISIEQRLHRSVPGFVNVNTKRVYYLCTEPVFLCVVNRDLQSRIDLPVLGHEPGDPNIAVLRPHKCFNISPPPGFLFGFQFRKEGGRSGKENPGSVMR